MNKIPGYTLILFLLLALQFAIFNHIYIGYGITMYVYILFFLILPLRTSGWLMLLLGFITGLAVDSVFNTGGIHAFSTVFICYFRPYVLRFFERSIDLELAFRPGIQAMGFMNFLRYTVFIVFIHNLFIFFLEVFHFGNFFFNLFLIIVNTLLTSFICIIFEALFKKEKFRT